MAFNKHRRGQAEPGQVSETGDTHSTVMGGPDNMAYPGFIPQRYIHPNTPRQQVDGGGASAVPNNTDRGEESHGIRPGYDSHVGPKDSHDAVRETEGNGSTPQNMPEADDNGHHQPPPLKVEVVNLDPDVEIVFHTDTYSIAASVVTASGNPTATGISPVRVLGKDPRRTKAYICVKTFTSGGNNAGGVASLPVMLASETQLPIYGFPIPLYSQTPLLINTTDEVWICGQNVGDVGAIAVYQERTVNADRYQKD